MNWKNISVLVTGGGGFIGSHLVERLLELEANVTAFVRYNSRATRGFLEKPDPARLKIVAGDLDEYESVRKALDGQEYVFHLGALISIPYSYHHPREVFTTNAVGTLNVLSAAQETQPAKVVVTSTSEVYGTARYVPIDEAHPLQGQSPYAASKIASDKLAESFHRSFELPVAIARPFNCYGPRQSMRAVIPTIMVQALRGTSVKLGALAPTRDFTFVKDTVEGFLAVASTPESSGEVFNLGSEFEISIGDLAKEIIHLANSRATIVQDNERLRPQKSEVERLFSTSRKAAKVLNWRATTSLREGLLATIEWVRSFLDQFPEGYQI
jgi:NAD dependent epimerase/dehydratase